MKHVKFGDCITICTIDPKNAYYLLHWGLSVTTYPIYKVTTFPKVISLTKFVSVGKCGVHYI